MSTVLWANLLTRDGGVTSDESDKWALFKYVDKLDKLASEAKLEPFSSLLDQTDLRFNLSDDDLPEGMTSTDELMARDGVWKPAPEALAILDGLLTLITAEKPRFGVMKNSYNTIVSELTESIEHAKKANAAGARFNFSVVM